LQRGGTGTATFHNADEGFEVVYQSVFADRWMVATELPHSVIYQPGAKLLDDTLVMVAPAAEPRCPADEWPRSYRL